MTAQPTDPKVYKPAWDNWSIITTAVCLIIAGVLIGTGLHYEELWYRVLFLVIGLILLLFVFTFPLRATLVEGRVIRLTFLLGSRSIDLKAFRLIGSGRDYAKGAWRLFASGGHFGYWGWWRLRDGRGFFSHLTSFTRNARFLSDGRRIIALNAPAEWFESVD